jgi:hypothetical protein
MGISAVNGISKTNAKKNDINGNGINSLVNGNGKRWPDIESDSEEDSKTRLIKKLASKKLELTQSINENKKSHKKSTVHAAISQTSTKLTTASAAQDTQPVAVRSVSTNAGSVLPSGTTPAVAGESLSTTHSTGLPTVAESGEVETVRNSETSETEEQERKRIKKEKKKEQKRLRKLEKQAKLT